ncbi:3-hydroxyacyl-CoA dehydrogenase NAD-binding domain-containing protein [Nonomuraea pusilla]|uniref:3-hydroxyacyl-CoA dehydrogenase NAD-binding domain-containing protein n=1 Tax=Nonomuraea pusilla TaxID=46177 RepID=UPI003B5B10E4
MSSGETYEKLARPAPPQAIFATDSSILLPSDMKDFTRRPHRFRAPHTPSRA